MDDSTQVFIVRFWKEPREIKGAFPQRRGSIEHIISHNKVDLIDLKGIPSFIEQYLDQAGLAPPASDRIKRLFKRLHGRGKRRPRYERD